ncbi:MAG: DNA-directed RNA polymerase subunit omega [Syntrophobacteraceae bacterium CG23_combo_of_CG06-09_8_20_14_all_50_8]|nr:MAG: DNA-directed RNA polymerase subunit omega [Syntrophobacteraceae bacterium CG23_combo_of_CG06-09_8_20_14_all_50_8]
MARITVEDSLSKAKNRFALVLLTAKRTRQLLKGSKPLTDVKNNREVVAALREIAAGKVMYAYPENLRGAKVDYKSVPDDIEFIGDEEDTD